jgi:molybdate transport system substrate-binding protein
MCFKPTPLRYLLVSLLLTLQSFSGSACQRSEAPLLVAAAISLRPLMEALQAEFPEGKSLRFSFSASGVIRQQIANGAPYDVFLSAGTQDIKKLQQAGIAGETYPLMHNPLVIARQKQSTPPCDPQSLLVNHSDKIAVGNPLTVPVGSAAQQALGTYWQKLSPQLILTENAYQNIVYLRNQAVEYAVIYQSDLKAYPETHACWTFNKNSGVQVTAFALKKAVSHPLQQQWVSFLRSPAIRKRWLAAGFSPL